MRGACFARPVMRAVCSVSARRLSSASFTASALGNALATFSYSKTRLLPFETRSKYFPRTPLPKSSRRYSARISSLALLIYSSFMSSCPSGADDSDSVGCTRRVWRPQAALRGIGQRSIANPLRPSDPSLFKGVCKRVADTLKQLPRKECHAYASLTRLSVCPIQISESWLH